MTDTMKQIEEMAWKLCDIPCHPNITSCEQCGNKRCHAMYYAERAYNAGYRKQVEGEWLEQKGVRGDGSEASYGSVYSYTYYKCSVCDDYSERETDYCQNCGARMKGGE